MIQSLISLLSSGVLLNPVVLCSVVLGLIFGIKLDFEQILAMYRNWHFYALGVVVAALYNFGLARQYQDDGVTLDYKAMIRHTGASFVLFVFANVLAVLFVGFIWF